MSIKRLDHVNFITQDIPATLTFYCDVIGLIHGPNLSVDTAKSLYLYIDGQDFPVLHIGNAKAAKKQAKFERIAEFSTTHTGEFSTGSFDHFCLQVDGDDYDMVITRLTEHGLDFQTHCHDDIPLKQIWLLDPNGVRVELNFVD